MNFIDLEKKYQVLRAQLDQKMITNEKFLEEAEKLAFKDKNGIWFRLDSKTGRRMKWDGKVWNPSDGGLPSNTFILIWSIIKGFVKNFPKTAKAMILRSLLMAALSGGIYLLIMRVNVLVIAKKNEGFSGINIPKTDPTYYLLNLYDNQAAFQAFCFLAFFVISLLYGRIKSKGIKMFALDIVATPSWTMESAKATGKRWYLVLLLCLTGGFGFSVFFNNNTYLLLSLVIGTFLSFTTQGKSFETTFIAVLWGDIQRLFRKKENRTIVKPETVSLGLLGAMLGFLSIMLIKPAITPVSKFLIWIPFVAIIVLSILMIIDKKHDKTVRKVMSIICLFTLGYFIFVYAREIFADDGGWAEGGSNWKDYKNSPGYTQTVAQGVKPGLLGMAGNLLGSIFSTGYNATKWVGGKVVDGTKAVGNFVYEGGKIVGGEIYDIGKGGYDLAKDIYNDPNIIVQGVKNMGSDIAEAAGTIKDVAVKTGEAIYDFGSDAVDLGKDIYNNPQILVDGLKNTAKDIKDGAAAAFDYTKDLATDVYNNPQIIVDTFTGSVDTVKNIASNVGDAIYTTVTDPKKAWEFVKDTVGLKNFGNCVDPNRTLLDRLGQVGVGVFKLGSTILTAGQAGTALKTAGSKGMGYVDDLLVAGSKGLKGGKSYVDDIVTKLKGGGKVVKPPKVPTSSTMGKLPVKPGPNYASAGTADLTGIPKSAQKSLQYVADDMGVQIHVRPSNPASKAWIESNKAVPKPCAVKAKTLNPIDEMIGGPKNQEGLVGMFEPKKPPEAMLKKMSPKTQELVNKRYDQRLDEWKRLSPEMKDLKGQYEVVDGVVHDVKAGKRIAGDQDLFDITNFDGTPVSDKVKQQVVDKLTGIEPSKVKHGAVTQWTKQGDPTQFSQKAKDGMIDAAKQIQQNGKSGEGVITFNPMNTSTKSFLN